MFLRDELEQSIRLLRYIMEIKMKNKKDATTINIRSSFELSTTQQILLGFLSAIIIGTILLSLPIATVSHETDILTSLFTATTSVCVTGLVVVDTFSHWTIFGKIVILILIQLGGLGIVAFTSLVMIVLHRKVGLKGRMVIQDAFGLDSLQGLVKFVKKVIKGSLVVEASGAVLYSFKLIPMYGAAKGIWYSVFNAISAFCNAGIDIIGSDSLMSFNTSPIMIFTSIWLIVSGGIGFIVWWDLLDVGKRVKNKQVKLTQFFKKLRVHTKVVLATSAFLIVAGWVLTFIFEYNNPETIGYMPLGDKIMNCLFQSVTLRTAGFASINQGGLSASTVLVSIMIMLVGGSPVGTAGGIKTVSIAVLFFCVISVVKGRKETIAFNRSVNDNVVKRALAVTFISITAFFIFSILLIITNDVDITDAMFEMASAVATVGLTRGITSTLNVAGKLIIIFAMYLGRIGPITMFIAFSSKYVNSNKIHYAEGNIIAG